MIYIISVSFDRSLIEVYLKRLYTTLHLTTLIDFKKKILDIWQNRSEIKNIYDTLLIDKNSNWYKFMIK